MDKLNGYKTYIVALCTIVWSIYGISAGLIDNAQGIAIIGLALQGAGLRHGISKQ